MTLRTPQSALGRTLGKAHHREGEKVFNVGPAMAWVRGYDGPSEFLRNMRWAVSSREATFTFEQGRSLVRAWRRLTDSDLPPTRPALADRESAEEWVRCQFDSTDEFVAEARRIFMFDRARITPTLEAKLVEAWRSTERVNA